jgi:hypothetical protein
MRHYCLHHFRNVLKRVTIVYITSEPPHPISRHLTSADGIFNKNSVTNESRLHFQTFTWISQTRHLCNQHSESSNSYMFILGRIIIFHSPANLMPEKKISKHATTFLFTCISPYTNAHRILFNARKKPSTVCTHCSITQVSLS